MPLDLRLNVNASKLTARMRRAVDRIRTTPLLEQIGKALAQYVDDAFARGGREHGPKWKPLRPNTVAAKGNRRILIDTGALRESIAYKVIPGARVQVGTDVPYAKFHQFGTAGPYFIFPKRPGGVLSFITTEGRVYATHVIHPGLPARPFLPTTTVAGRIASAETRKAVKDALTFPTD